MLLAQTLPFNNDTLLFLVQEKSALEMGGKEGLGNDRDLCALWESVKQ